MCEFYLNDVKIKGACGIYTFAEVCDGQKLEKMVTVRHCNGTIGPSGEIASYLDFYGFPEANAERHDRVYYEEPLKRTVKRFLKDLPKKLKQIKNENSADLVDRDLNGKVDHLYFSYSEQYPQIEPENVTYVERTTFVTIEAGAELAFCAETFRNRGTGCDRGEKALILVPGRVPVLANRTSKLNSKDICATGRAPLEEKENCGRLGAWKVDPLRIGVGKYLRQFDKFLRAERK